MKGVQSDAKREQDTLNRRQKDYSISLKNLKRAEQQLVNTQSLVPFMKRQIEDASRQVVVLKEEGKRQVAAAEEVRREVDVFINNFLKQEGLEAEKAEWVRAVVDEVKSLEEEVVEVAKEERDQRKIVAQLNEEREIEARKAAKAMHGAKAVNEELKVKELIIMDLSKRDAETRAKLREFSKLYDIVKTDRNKYVNQIQSSTQALAEMKEKTKILMNEVSDQHHHHHHHHCHHHPRPTPPIASLAGRDPAQRVAAEGHGPAEGAAGPRQLVLRARPAPRRAEPQHHPREGVEGEGQPRGPPTYELLPLPTTYPLSHHRLLPLHRSTSWSPRSTTSTR